MKEIYEKPEIAIIVFDTEDIVTSSGEYQVGDEGGDED